MAKENTKLLSVCIKKSIKYRDFILNTNGG